MKELGTHQERKTVGRYMRIYFQYSVVVQSHYNTFKYIWIIPNVHNTLENAHILSTHKLVLATECTEDYKIHKCNKFYNKW